MNRLFDKALRGRVPLRWLGTRPIDDVRAAERRARVAVRPTKGGRVQRDLGLAGPTR